MLRCHPARARARARASAATHLVSRAETLAVQEEHRQVAICAAAHGCAAQPDALGVARHGVADAEALAAAANQLLRQETFARAVFARQCNDGERARQTAQKFSRRRAYRQAPAAIYLDER